MLLPAQLAQDLLLGLLLAPFLAAVLIFVFQPAAPRSLQAAACLGVLLGFAALVLGLQLWLAPQSDEPARIVVGWQLPLLGGGRSWADRVTWGADPMSASLLALAPWLFLTGLAFRDDEETSSNAVAGKLLLLGGMNLFLAGWDYGSLLTGACGTTLGLGLSIARCGGKDRRAAASRFIVAQLVGIGLLTIALAMWTSQAAILRSAPRGVPGDAVGSLPELADLIQASLQKRPGAQFLWEQQRGLPAGLWLAGAALLSASFPLHGWLSGTLASGSISQQLWLLLWTKATLLVGLRTALWIDPAMLGDWGARGVCLTVLGALIFAALLLSQKSIPDLVAYAIGWTQQLAWGTALLLRPDHQPLGPLLACQLAGLAALLIPVAWLSRQSGRQTLAEWQGRARGTPGLGAALLCAVWSLPLGPSGLGLFLLWGTLGALQQSESSSAGLCQWAWAVSALLGLAGFARIAGGLLLRRAAPPEIAGEAGKNGPCPSAASAQLTGWQRLTVAGWGLLAISISLLYPLILLFPPPAPSVE
jgi:hypothetical protein